MIPLLLEDLLKSLVSARSGVRDLVRNTRSCGKWLPICLLFPRWQPVCKDPFNPALRVGRASPLLPGAAKIVRMDAKPRAMRQRESAYETNRNQDPDERANILYLHKHVISPTSGDPLIVVRYGFQNRLREPKTEMPVMLIQWTPARGTQCSPHRADLLIPLYRCGLATGV
jgi:hypothetical protein